MKSVGGTLRKKGLGGAEHFMKKDKHKQHSNASSVSSPTASSISSPKSITSPHPPKSLAPSAAPTVAKVAPSAPIIVDLHRFADDNLQPEECK
jgi:hypothetical protein